MPIHLIDDINKEEIYHPDDPGVRYRCITACYPTPSKSTRDPGKVTCKNCLRSIEKAKKAEKKKRVDGVPGGWRTIV